jgi:hypothetical protein
MTDTESLPAANAPRDLTYDQRIAAEAAFRGLPPDPKWPSTARAIYDGVIAAMEGRAEQKLREESESLTSSQN